MDDARAVMDAVRMERAAIVGYSHAAPMAMTFAATYPECTSALVLFGTFACGCPSNYSDFRIGHSRAQVDRFLGQWAAPCLGTPDTVRAQYAHDHEIG